MVFSIFEKEGDVIVTSSHPLKGQKAIKLKEEGYNYKYSFKAFDKGSNYEIKSPYVKNLEKVLDTEK